jgi:hypothetical protein
VLTVLDILSPKLPPWPDLARRLTVVPQPRWITQQFGEHLLGEVRKFDQIPNCAAPRPQRRARRQTQSRPEMYMGEASS